MGSSTRDKRWSDLIIKVVVVAVCFILCGVLSTTHAYLSSSSLSIRRERDLRNNPAEFTWNEDDEEDLNFNSNVRNRRSVVNNDDETANNNNNATTGAATNSTTNDDNIKVFTVSQLNFICSSL